MTIRALRLAAMCMLLGSPALAGHAGADPFEFLFLDAGAKQAALGGAFGAAGDDADVLAYNPAGLGFMEESKASFMHNSHFQDVSRRRLSVAWSRGLAFSVDRLSYGMVRRTTLSNPTGTDLDEFTPSAMVLAGGLGIRPAESWSAGLALKHVSETLDSVKASALAVDVGGQYHLESPAVLLGLTIQNIGPKVTYISKPEALPVNAKLGAAVQSMVFGVPVGLLMDINKSPGRDFILNIGGTAAIFTGFSLRAGYNGRNDAGLGLTTGFGLTLGRFTLDYALVPFGDLGSSHLLNIGVSWGAPTAEPVPTFEPEIEEY